jgi:hypothetical protein
MRKIIILVLSFFAIIIIGYFIYVILIAIASQKMPVVEMSKELKELEKIIQKETDGGSAYFYPIPEYEIEECNAIINIDLSIRNDSLTQSKEKLDNYIKSVSKRVNETIVNKKCIDSLIVEVSSYNSKEKVDTSKSKRYRYSFPIY